LKKYNTRTHEEGTSFAANCFVQYACGLYIHRIQLIIDFFDERRFRLERFVQFSGPTGLPAANAQTACEHLSPKTYQPLAYEVAEHKSHSGEHYIATIAERVSPLFSWPLCKAE
jgi:site-specific recombinase